MNSIASRALCGSADRWQLGRLMRRPSLKVLIAHPGTQYSHQLVKQFERQEVLFRYWTGICIPEFRIFNTLLHLLPRKYGAAVSNRTLRNVAVRKIRCQPFNELKSLAKMRAADNTEAIVFERNRIFQEAISASDIRKCDIVVGFDTSSWLLAERARDAGKPFVLDYSTIHSRAKESISDEVLRKYPEWSFNITRKSAAHLELEAKELALADVVAVASSFTKWSLVQNGVSEDKVMINPYGVDTAHFKMRSREQNGGHPLRFVFLGAVNALKGVPMVVEFLASAEGAKCDFTIIGPVRENVKAEINRLAPNVTLLGKVAHAKLPSLLHEYDVMVFPSYFEGFGQVILEAMAAGLAVITSKNTCGPDVIDNDRDGVLISAGDQGELREAIARLSLDPDAARQMGRLAAAKARDYTWDSYGERWLSILEKSDKRSIAI